MNWILCEDPGTPLWCLQPMEKCIQTRRHNYTLTIKSVRDSANDSLAVLSLGKTLRRPWVFLWVDQRSKTTVDQRGRDNYVQNASSTSPLQDLSSASPAQERSDGLAPGDWCGSPLPKPNNKIKSTEKFKILVKMTNHGAMDTITCKIDFLLHHTLHIYISPHQGKTQHLYFIIDVSDMKSNKSY